MRRIGIVAVALLLAPLAFAHDRYVVEERPQQECWTERVQDHGGGDYTGALLGGAAGGLLGSQIGGGNGRVAAAAVGAGTGAIVGDRLARQQGGYRDVQRCRTVMRPVRVPVAREVVFVERHDNGLHRGWHKGKHKHKHHRHHDDD